MPFHTDGHWPAGLLTIFDHARAKQSTFENRYYGPYDKLLNYCFGGNFNFYVAPQNPTRDDSRETVDSTVLLVVFDVHNKPVMIIEVKDDLWAQNAELRFRADAQMRDRYAIMLGQCPLPRLWGISLLGTFARVYCGDRDSYELEPPAVPRPDPLRLVPLTFLAGEWNLDITSPEGFAKLKEIVTDILEYAGNV